MESGICNFLNELTRVDLYRRYSMKKILVMLLALSMFMLVACSGGQTESKPADDGAKAGEGDGKLKVVAVINGNLGDKSFFDSVDMGLKELGERDNVETKLIETGYDETKWEPALLDASESDADIIVTGTYQMADYVTAAAKQFPDKKYIIFDTTVDFSDGQNKNVYAIEYKQNEASYLAGAIAATMSETGKIGYVGGMDIPVINDFLVGYIEGAQYVNGDVKVAISYIGDFADSGKGKEMGFAQLNQGVDVIFPAASTAGNGALEAAKEKGVYAVGVDSDQAVLFRDAGDEELANLITTSVLKDVGHSIVRAIDLDAEGKLPWGSGERLGFKEGAVGIAKNDIYNVVVPENARKLADELEEKIKNGEIEVKSAFGMDADALNEIRDAVKP